MFPKKISATNIELLIRSPYSFYARNILKLYKIDNIFDKKILSGFGNFIHKTIELYTKEYDSDIGEKLQLNKLISIAYENAKQNSIDKNILNLWWPKFEAIASEFILFDNDRRLGVKEIIAEQAGEININIRDEVITITAIADRIEVGNNGSINILDYKTGSIPTKASIFQGISVQLIIEAIIAKAGGFGILNNNNIEEIIYVKFASNPPYIQTTKINIAEIDLEYHKKGLIKLLTYYIDNPEFKVNNNEKFAPRYDDYRHLARME